MFYPKNGQYFSCFSLDILYILYSTCVKCGPVYYSICSISIEPLCPSLLLCCKSRASEKWGFLQVFPRQICCQHNCSTHTHTLEWAYTVNLSFKKVSLDLSQCLRIFLHFPILHQNGMFFFLMPNSFNYEHWTAYYFSPGLPRGKKQHVGGFTFSIFIERKKTLR